jgi:hypothetical protein
MSARVRVRVRGYLPDVGQVLRVLDGQLGQRLQ